MKVSGWENVRRYMLEGWQLGRSLEGWWLQKNGLGKGGESKQVHARTGWKMLKEKRIKKTSTENTPWYRTDYTLTN